MANSNPGFVDDQKPDAVVWNAAFTAKVDAVNGQLTSPLFAAFPVNATSDTLAAAAGVPLGGVYRNGSQLMIRVT